VAEHAALTSSGQFADALDVVRAAMSKPAARHDPFVEVHLLYCYIITADMAGDREAVARAADRGHDLAASPNPSTRAYAWLTEAWGVQLADPQQAVALTRTARELAESVRNTWVGQLATVLTFYWSEPSGDAVAEIAITHETLRQGMLTVAWQRLALVARPLADSGFPELATQVLGACRQSPGTATVIDAKFGSLCDVLRSTLGGHKYDRLSAQGSTLDLPSILRLVEAQAFGRESDGPDGPASKTRATALDR
jgi:hypothetical protein